MTKRILWFLVLFTAAAGAVSAQEISERKEIAVFGLSYYDWMIPTQTLGMVDGQIKNVFVNLGRFDVIGMNYRLAGNDVNAFIEKIKEVKEQNAEIPQSVQLGQEAFTEADFNKLVSSFIVVIPVMTYYNLSVDDDGYYTAEIETGFTVINVQEIKTIAYFSVRTSSGDDKANTAIKEAVDQIPMQLEYEIRKIPEFQLKSGIVDVLRGDEVAIEFGKNMGLKKGDEYAIVRQQQLSSGYKSTERKGLLVIKDVKDEYSIAKIIYSKGAPMIGEQVREIPKLGTDTTVYAHGLYDLFGSGKLDVTAGFRQSLSRGFYSARPLVGIEVPLTEITVSGIPINFYVGGELNLWLRRLQIVPMAGIGATLTIQRTDDAYLSHFGFITQLGINYLFGDMVRVGLEAGYSQWFLLSGSLPYGGILFGASVQVKY